MAHHHNIIERPQPIIRADAMQFIRLERRDVARMERFLVDFGLIAAGYRDDMLYFRGYGDAPFLLSIKPSDRDAFVGFGLAAREAGDLEAIASATGSTIRPSSEPGGGICVTLTDPDGLRVDLVHGFGRVPPLETRGSTFPFNTPAIKARLNATVRPSLEPSPIFKFGHVVLQRPDFRRASQWYMRHFGIIPTDVQYLPDGQPALGFFRLDRGAEAADHHSIALVGGPETKMLHVAFETFDLDSIGQGNQYLRAAGWDHFWGIGRHLLGSQLFDYWKDPVGDEWEHYADGDVMNADYPTNYTALNRGGLWSWGHDLPASMRPPIAPEDVEALHAAGGFGAIELSFVKGLIEAFDLPPRPWLR